MSSKFDSYPDIYEAIMGSDELSSNQVFIKPKPPSTDGRQKTHLASKPDTNKPDLQIHDEYQATETESDPEVLKLNQIVNGEICDDMSELRKSDLLNRLDNLSTYTDQLQPKQSQTISPQPTHQQTKQSQTTPSQPTHQQTKQSQTISPQIPSLQPAQPLNHTIIKSIHSNLQSLSKEKKELFMQITIPTEETINQYLVPVSTDQITRCAQDMETFETIMGFISVIEKFDETPDSTLAHSPQILFYFFLYLCQNRHLLLTKPTYAILVKALFHEYIVQKGFTNLVTIYDRVFNDKLYADINNTAVFYPILTQEWIRDKIHDFQEKSKQIEYRRRAKRVPPKYEVAEIVGAKDKEGRWWMSKVLAVYDYQGHSAYYVEFLGWGDKFNEFIIDGFRIEKFNPKKHRYFRPAWRAKAVKQSEHVDVKTDNLPKYQPDISGDDVDIKDGTN